MRIQKALLVTCGVAAMLATSSALSAQTKITSTGKIYPPASSQQPKPDPELEQEPTSQSDLESQEALDEEQLATEQTDEPEEDEESLSQSDRLDLVCRGTGSANKATVGTLSGWNSYGNTYGATVFGQRSQGFADEVRVRLIDSDPRIRMPRTMLPTIRGGENGWFKLKNVETSEGEITASIAVNMFNNPKLRLDRYTGGISISGKAGDYTGECRKFVPKKTKKAF